MVSLIHLYMKSKKKVQLTETENRKVVAKYQGLGGEGKREKL